MTRAVLVQGGQGSVSGAHLLLFRPDPIVHLGGTHDLSFMLKIEYVAAPVEADRRRWQARTVSYYYEFILPNGRQLLSYHWHPVGRSPIVWPHVHLPSHTAPVDLSRAHLPTRPVGLEAVLRLAIEDVGVRPLRADWREVLEAGTDEL